MGSKTMTIGGVCMHANNKHFEHLNMQQMTHNKCWSFVKLKIWFNLNHDFSDVRARENRCQALQDSVDTMVNLLLGIDLSLSQILPHLLSKVPKTIKIRTH